MHGLRSCAIMSAVTDRTPFPELADALRRSVDMAAPKLRALSASRAAQAPSPGKWSPQELIGHLIDSATNNHQRFVRAQQGPSLTLPAYAQEHWVASQHYGERAWDDLTTFWHLYNLHLAHVIAHIPEEHRDVPCTIGTYAPVTLGFLAHDYIVHMEHHLRQIQDQIATAP
jgi:hypothetical protein